MPKVKKYWAPLLAFLLPFIFYGAIFFGRSFGLECATGVMGFYPPYNQNAPLYNKNSFCLFISDVGSFAWNGAPLSIKAASEYKSLTFPLWNQNIGSGAPLAADFISGSYFIPNIISAMFGSVFAFDFYFVFRMAVISLGFFLFLRSFRLPNFVCLIGSLIGFLNGYITYLPNIQHQSVDILLPWIALFINKSYSTKKLKYFVLLALACGLSHLGGMPESSIYILLFYFAYTTFISLIIEKKSKLKILVSYYGTFALGLMLASILIIPGYEFINYGKNPHAIGIAQQYSLNFNNIFFVLFPRMFGTLGETNWLAPKFNFPIWVLEYVGTFSIVILLLIPFFILLKRNKLSRFPFIAFYLFFIGFFLILFTQYFGIIHYPLFEKIPGFSQTNFPKYILGLLNLLVATLVSITIYYYIESTAYVRNKIHYIKQHMSLFISCTVFFTFILFTYFHFKEFVQLQNIYKHFVKNFIFVIGTIIAIISILISPLLNKFKYFFLFLVVGLEFFLLLPNSGNMQRYDSFKQPPAVDFLKNHNPDLSRIFSPNYILYPNYASIFNLNDIRNLDAIWINNYHSYISNFITDPVNYRFTGETESGSTESARFTNNVYFDLLSVKYILSYKDINAYEDSPVIRSYISQVKDSPLVRSDIFSIKGITRPVLFEHPTSSITLFVNKPENSSYFILYPAMSPDVYSDPSKGDGVKFTATVFDGDKILFKNSLSIDPKNNKADEKWGEFKLGPFPEYIKNFRLILETDPLATTAWDWAGWGGFEWDNEISGEKTYQYKKVYDSEMKIYENTHFIPRLHPISEVTCSKSEENTISQMKDNEPKMRDLGIVLSPNCKQEIFNTEDISLTNQKFEDQKVSFTYSSSHSSYIILSNTFYPGWKLKINGKSYPIDQVNLAFQGLKLPAGYNLKIEIVYDPISFKLGASITFITLGFCVFILLSRYRNKKI